MKTAVILGPNVEAHDDPARVIGRRTNFRGNEHPYLRGYDVAIVAVLKGALRPRDLFPHGRSEAELTNGSERLGPPVAKFHRLSSTTVVWPCRAGVGFPATCSERLLGRHKSPMVQANARSLGRRSTPTSACGGTRSIGGSRAGGSPRRRSASTGR